MSRPLITQTNGKFPRHAFQDLQVQEDIVTNLNEHATALDSMGPGTPVTTSGNISGTGSVIDPVTMVPGPSVTDLVFNAPATPSALPSGNTNDYNPTGWATTTLWRLSANSAGSTLTGLTATTDGRIRILQNLGTGPLLFSNQDSGSAAANRIVSPAGATVAVLPGGAAVLAYNTVNSRWYLLAESNNGSPVVLDPKMQSTGPVTLASGLTSDWNAFGTGTPTQVVLVTPNTAGSQIDGMLADGSNVAPINGAVRIIVHSALNHGALTFLNAEGSASAAANQFYLHSDSNISGSGYTIGHRDAAVFVYNSDRSKWQLVSGSVFRKLTLTGAITDVALGATVNNYAPAGIQYSTTLRLAPSGGNATITGILGGSDGDILVVQAFGTLIFTHQDAGSSAGNKFLLPGGTSMTINNYGAAIFRYDSNNSSWMVVSKV